MATRRASIVEVDPTAPSSAPANRPSCSITGTTSPTALTIRLTGASVALPRTVSASTTEGMHASTPASHAAVNTARGLASLRDSAMIAPLSRMSRLGASFAKVLGRHRGARQGRGQLQHPLSRAGPAGDRAGAGGEAQSTHRMKARAYQRDFVLLRAPSRPGSVTLWLRSYLYPTLSRNSWQVKRASVGTWDDQTTPNEATTTESAKSSNESGSGWTPSHTLIIPATHSKTASDPPN